MQNKPYAPACDRNRDYILSELTRLFDIKGISNKKTIVEVGSGTGQHGVYFAENLRQVQWQPTDQPQHLQGIQSWIDDSGLGNINSPKAFTVGESDWPLDSTCTDVVFTSNTLHIMSWELVKTLLSDIGENLVSDGLLIVYGPFNYAGNYTSESNKEFDSWLKKQHPLSAIRDFEALVELAENNQLQLVEDNEMPANNRLLVFKKIKKEKQ